MKEKIKRISSSTWALLLALMMVVSSFSVLAATTNVNKTSAFNGTVYFKYNDGNSDKYIYTWNSSNKVEGTGKWPGTKMTNLGNGIYSYVFDNTNSCDMVIFNDKGNSGGSFQTGDVTFPTDGRNMYDYTSSKWTTYSASTKVATSVSLSSNATVGKITQGNDLILTAKATGKVDGDVTYTFYNGGTQVGQAQTTTENTATTTVSGLSAGDYTFTVKVTKDGYTSVTDTVQVKVVAPAKEMYLYGDFDSNADHMWNADFKDYKFEYVNGKYVLKNVPFTGSVGGKETDYAFFRIYVSDDEQYSSTTEADQELNNGVTANIRKYNDKALKFKVPTSKRVNIEFDLEKLQITVTEVVVNCKMNAKYQISDTGSPFQDAVDDKNIATVNDDLTATVLPV